MLCADRQGLVAAIFDVDGVLVASPHERAWREALHGIAEPERFTTAVYQAYVAGKPRLDGARAVLEQLGVAHAAEVAPVYAERKQRRIEELIAAGTFTAFADGLRFVHATRASGLQLAVASSSKNANSMLQRISVGSGKTLFDLFDVNVCGRDLPMGKPHPEIFLLAARELAVDPANCFVVEDAAAGIEAAKAGGMTALGVARLSDEALLRAAGADLVVANLDEVTADALPRPRLCSRDA